MGWSIADLFRKKPREKQGQTPVNKKEKPSRIEIAQQERQEELRKTDDYRSFVFYASHQIVDSKRDPLEELRFFAETERRETEHGMVSPGQERAYLDMIQDINTFKKEHPNATPADIRMAIAQKYYSKQEFEEYRAAAEAARAEAQRIEAERRATQEREAEEQRAREEFYNNPNPSTRDPGALPNEDGLTTSDARRTLGKGGQPFKEQTIVREQPQAQMG